MRSTAAIQAQIDATEAYLASGGGLLTAQSVNGVSSTNMSAADAEKLLSRLYAELDRATGRSPMFARGRVLGTR